MTEAMIKAKSRKVLELRIVTKDNFPIDCMGMITQIFSVSI